LTVNLPRRRVPGFLPNRKSARLRGRIGRLWWKYYKCPSDCVGVCIRKSQAEFGGLPLRPSPTLKTQPSEQDRPPRAHDTHDPEELPGTIRKEVTLAIRDEGTGDSRSW
jgi:hypothetical protein